MASRATVLALLAMVMAGPAAADQNDPRLEAHFAQLLAAPDAQSAQPAETSIWQIWFEHEDEAVRILMSEGGAAMNRGDARAAMRNFDQVIGIDPGFAEGWNRRATLNYMIGAYDASLADIEKTLALEPRHFGALSGRGLVYSQLEEWDSALQSFEAALEVHPSMQGARINAEEIRRDLKDREI
jgi:tetratricopeptide (TPR) repeat protein